MRRHADGFNPSDIKGAGLEPVASAADIEEGIRQVSQVQISSEVIAYIVDIARATRQAPSLSLGMSPRAATALLAAARAWAWLSGRDFVTPDDVKALVMPTIAHRLVLRAEAELEGVSIEAVLAGALDSISVPR